MEEVMEYPIVRRVSKILAHSILQKPETPIRAPSALIDKHLHVSQTSFKDTLERCGIPEEHILSLPQKVLIVEAGCGWRQEFLKELHSRRPDLRLVGIDPTLFLDPRATNVLYSEQGDAALYSVVSYDVPERDHRFFSMMQKNRQLALSNKSIRFSGAIAPEMSGLQVHPSSVELWIDSMGPNLALSDEDFPLYLRKVTELLKPGGKAHFYPVGIAHGVLLPWTLHPEELALETVQKIEHYGLPVTITYEYDHQGIKLHLTKNLNPRSRGL